MIASSIKKNISTNISLMENKRNNNPIKNENRNDLEETQNDYYIQNNCGYDEIRYQDIIESFYDGPLSSNYGEDNIIVEESAEFSNFLDNQKLRSQARDVLNSSNKINTLKSSFLATYLAFSSLENLNYDGIDDLSYSLKLFILSHYNNITHHFEEPIPEYFYNQTDSPLNILYNPNSPWLSHLLGIILLGKTGYLSSLDSTSIIGIDDMNTWIDEIKNTQNEDGGFGKQFSPNSTLLETYLSIQALFYLYNKSLSGIPPLMAQQISNFIYEKQRAPSWAPIMFGVFSEYDPDLGYGWDYFLASWLALESLSFLKADLTPVRDDFIEFIQNNSIYQSEFGTFVGQWNEKYENPRVPEYYGNAIILECIRVLDAESEFIEYNYAQTILLGATYNQIYNLTSDFDYFLMNGHGDQEDLMTQFLSIFYLNKTGAIESLSYRDRLINYLKSLFIPMEGATLYSYRYKSIIGEYYKYSYLRLPEKIGDYYSKDLYDSQEILREILNRRENDNHFRELEDPEQTTFNKKYSLLDHWSYNRYLIMEQNYAVARLLTIMDLWNDFYSEVGLTLLDYEAYPAQFLTAEGFFRNSTVNTGNLKSTFEALQYQKDFMTFSGNKWDSYYNDTQISQIESYVISQAQMNSTDWWINPNLISQNKEFGPFEATYYGYKILDLLDKQTLIDLDKLKNWVINSIQPFDYKIKNMNIREQAFFWNLLHLLKISIKEINNISYGTTQNQIRTFYLETINKKGISLDWCSFAEQIETISDIIVKYNIPKIWVDQGITSCFQFISASSIERVESLILSTPSAQTTQWNYDQDIYFGQISVSLTTNYNNTIPINIQWTWQSNQYFFELNKNIYYNIDIQVIFPEEINNSYLFNITWLITSTQSVLDLINISSVLDIYSISREIDNINLLNNTIEFNSKLNNTRFEKIWRDSDTIYFYWEINLIDLITEFTNFTNDENTTNTFNIKANLDWSCNLFGESIQNSSLELEVKQTLNNPIIENLGNDNNEEPNSTTNSDNNLESTSNDNNSDNPDENDRSSENIFELQPNTSIITGIILTGLGATSGFSLVLKNNKRKKNITKSF